MLLNSIVAGFSSVSAALYAVPGLAFVESCTVALISVPSVLMYLMTTEPAFS